MADLFRIFNAQSTTKVISGRNTTHQMTSLIMHVRQYFMSAENWVKQLKKTWKVEMRKTDIHGGRCSRHRYIVIQALDIVHVDMSRFSAVDEA